MNVMDRINAALAQPHTHAVVTTYRDGKTRQFTTRNAASAESYAVGERRKIGRDLISHDFPYAKVRVIAVDVLELV